jgi:hypothetical protein
MEKVQLEFLLLQIVGFVSNAFAEKNHQIKVLIGLISLLLITGCASTKQDESSHSSTNKVVTINVSNIRTEDFKFSRADEIRELNRYIDSLDSKLEYYSEEFKEDAKNNALLFLAMNTEVETIVSVASLPDAKKKLDEDLEMALTEITNSHHSLFSHSTFITHYDLVKNRYRANVDIDNGVGRLVFIKQWKTKGGTLSYGTIDMGSPGKAIVNLNISKSHTNSETIYKIKVVDVDIEGPKVNLIQPIASVEFDLTGFLIKLSEISLVVEVIKPKSPNQEIVNLAKNDVNLTLESWREKDTQMKMSKLKDEARNVKAFRDGLRLGIQSNCGMVVQIRDELAEVQRNKQRYWVKISELYPLNMNKYCYTD